MIHQGPGVLRFAVLTALERARERVAHGHPSLCSALKYQRLSARAWAEVDRAVDDVRFELGPAPFAWAPRAARGEGPAHAQLRELLRVARENKRLPWEDPGGLCRERCVALLTCAIERTRALPAVSHGPMFHHLPITRDQ